MKRTFTWHWILCFLFLGFTCFLPTDTAQAAVTYDYYYDEKKDVYFIEDVHGAGKNEVIELPNSYNGRVVVGIKKNAFKDDEKIKKVTIPYSYTTIESFAFYNCSNLQEVLINADIKVLKTATFWKCPKLEKIVLPESLQTIKGSAISETGIKSIIIPKSVKKIDAGAFGQNENLGQIILEGKDIDIEGFIAHSQVTIVASEDNEAYKYGKEHNGSVSTSDKLKVELAGTKMYVGERKTLKIYNNPYKVKLSSSNKSVVSIDKEGGIVAKKKGKATVTAKINGKNYKFKITVVKRTQKNVLNIIWSNYVTKDMSDYEKVEAAFDWVMENVEYDERFYNGNMPYSSHTAKGAFEKGVAVCDGLTGAFHAIIKHYGIPVKTVTGTAGGGGHSWSLVKIGNDWYHADVTWGYFLFTDKAIDGDHDWNKNNYPKTSYKRVDKNVTTLHTNGTKINILSKELYVGKTTTLKVTGTSQKVKWSTSNKKIVTVNSKGKITAKKAGTAKVYCKINGKKYAVKIKVKNPYLNETKVSMVKGGDTFKLKLTGATAKKYSSSKSSVVSVSKKGVLTAKKAGTATISVKASNGKTYKCKVTVKAYAISQSKQTVAVGDTYQLYVKNSDKDTRIHWKSSNTKVASVDGNGTVTPNKKGTTTISAVIGGASYKCKVTVHEHNAYWIADNKTHGAKAKLICKDCGATVQEGIQLIDSEGNIYYGNWNTNTEILPYLNQAVAGDPRENMTEDASLKPQLLEVMFSYMKNKQNIISNENYTRYWDEYYFMSVEEDADLSDNLSEFFRHMSWPYDWAAGKYTHQVGILSFTWDVYGDGKVCKVLYVMTDEYELIP